MKLLLSFFIILSSTFECISQNTRTNIILITTHDIGQHLGCYGVQNVRTPNIDRLATQGIQFQNFYSTSAVCTPGRGSLLTGRYPQSNGLMGLTHAPWWWSFNEGERHIASRLKDQGFKTYLIGLQHVTQGPVEELGYQHFLSRSRKAEETVAETITLISEARNFDQPFFAKVGFTEVHRPFRHGKDTADGLFVPPYLQNTPEIRSDLADFQATIHYFDQKVGDILSALEQSAIAENTLVILTSEHGIPYPGSKWAVRKAGIEIPLIIYQKGKSVFSGGTVYDQVMSNVDVLPTLFDYLKLPVPENVEGVSFWPLLAGDKSLSPRQYAFSQYTPDMKRDNLSRSIISGNFHLIRYFDQGRAVIYPTDADPLRFAAHIERAKTNGTRPFWQLFDLENDPYELNDLGQDPEYTQIVEEMSDELLNWMKTVKDQLLEGPLETPYYQKAMQDFTGDE